MIKKEASQGYVYQLAKESDRMHQATMVGDTGTMEEILESVHDTETPILSYNNETELSAVVNLVYLSARDCYRVVREEKAGKGFVDFIFYPELPPAKKGIILELKVDHSPQEAIDQIKEIMCSDSREIRDSQEEHRAESFSWELAMTGRRRSIAAGWRK